MNIIKGNLITLFKEGKFDVIGHGCNCMSKQHSGIAVQMVEHFSTDFFPMELSGPDLNKLGCIDAKVYDHNGKDKIVVNMYSQHLPGKAGVDGVPLDYVALQLTLRKLNVLAKGTHVGLPWIGCGLAGGDKERVQKLIEQELTDCEVTIVEYDKQN